LHHCLKQANRRKIAQITEKLPEKLHESRKAASGSDREQQILRLFIKEAPADYNSCQAGFYAL